MRGWTVGGPSCRLAAMVAGLATALWVAGAAAETKVVVTIKPVHALVAAVMGETGRPGLLLEGVASPHDYALRPSDVSRLNAADVVVRVSAGLETFLGKPLSLLPKTTTVLTLDRLPGLTLHAIRSGDGYEAHDHSGHGHGHGHAHGGHSHGRKEKGRSEPRDVDTHLWLDPANAKVIAKAVAEALGQRVPAEAATFTRNAEALVSRLEALDAQLSRELTPLRAKPYIVFHDAYQYLERRYGLAGVGSVTLNPDVPPSAQRLTRLRARLAKAGVQCVFAEPQFPPKAVETVIEGTRVRKGVLDPLGAAITPGPEHYFGLMERLVRDLRACLVATG